MCVDGAEHEGAQERNAIRQRNSAFPWWDIESVALESMLSGKLFMDVFLPDDGDFIFSDFFF